MERLDAGAPALLVLGSSKFYLCIRDRLKGVASVTHVPFSMLKNGMLNALEPDFIIAPLFSQNMDCLDFGEAIQAVGYKGCSLFISESLPNPTMIEKEIRQHVPGLDFHILPSTSLRQVIAGQFH